MRISLLVTAILALYACTSQSETNETPQYSQTIKVIESIGSIPNGTSGNTITVKELKFTGKILEIVAKCRTDGPCVMTFDGIAVNFGPFINTNLYKRSGGGGVEWIKPITNEFDKYIGMEAEVSCYTSVSRQQTWKNNQGVTIPLCIPHGNPKYYVRFKP